MNQSQHTMLLRATLPQATADLTATEVEEDMVEPVVGVEVPSSSPGWRACLAGLSLGEIIARKVKFR